VPLTDQQADEDTTRDVVERRLVHRDASCPPMCFTVKFPVKRAPQMSGG
jgi:hypothetical protein